MNSQQFRRIIQRAHELIGENRGNTDVVGDAVARATFEVRGNHSEVHLTESELRDLMVLAAELRRVG